MSQPNFIVAEDSAQDPILTFKSKQGCKDLMLDLISKVALEVRRLEAELSLAAYNKEPLPKNDFFRTLAEFHNVHEMLSKAQLALEVLQTWDEIQATFKD